jgi:hypothetical protein
MRQKMERFGENIPRRFLKSTSVLVWRLFTQAAKQKYRWGDKKFSYEKIVKVYYRMNKVYDQFKIYNNVELEAQIIEKIKIW